MTGLAIPAAAAGANPLDQVEPVHHSSERNPGPATRRALPAITLKPSDVAHTPVGRPGSGDTGHRGAIHQHPYLRRRLTGPSEKSRHMASAQAGRPGGLAVPRGQYLFRI
uniref:Uncharacterized protein n=1 Tax=Streptomyces hygroscopicus subsp. hygroscopicus TaxID=68042 RepID=Q2MFT7_STRHY|nr:hypothetical protein [Streptomyces hygroscopicus subsp. hygroscopicus]